MNANELMQILQTLGVANINNELVSSTGMSRFTVRRWLLGINKIPVYVQTIYKNKLINHKLAKLENIMNKL